MFVRLRVHSTRLWVVLTASSWMRTVREPLLRLRTGRTNCLGELGTMRTYSVKPISRCWRIFSIADLSSSTTMRRRLILLRRILKNGRVKLYPSYKTSVSTSTVCWVNRFRVLEFYNINVARVDFSVLLYETAMWRQSSWSHGLELSKYCTHIHYDMCHSSQIPDSCCR